MNSRKLSILGVALVLLFLSELFPPWLYEDGWDSAKRSAGYHFINNPPKVKSSSEMKKIFLLPDSNPPHFFTIQEDIGRLYSQRLSILFLTPGLLLTLSSQRSLSMMVVGGFFICIGIVFLFLVLKFSWSVHY